MENKFGMGSYGKKNASLSSNGYRGEGEGGGGCCCCCCCCCGGGGGGGGGGSRGDDD